VLLLGGGGPERFEFVDSFSYLEVARSLPSGLWAPEGDAISASLARTPGYPLVLGAFGATASSWAFIAVQCLIGGVVNVLLTHRLGRQIASPQAALLAAAFVAFDPASLGHNLLVATETVVATALLASALLALRIYREPSVAGAVGLGLVGGSAALLRPNLVIVPIVLAIAVALGRRSTAGLRLAMVVGAVGLLLPGLWLVRNHAVGGTWSYATVGGQNLADFGLAASAVEGGRIGLAPPDRDRQAAAIAAEAARVGLSGPVDDDVTSSATDAAWRSEGRELLSDHPRGAVVVASQGVVRMVASPGHTGLLVHLPGGPSGPLRWAVGPVALAALVLLWAGVLDTAWRALRRDLPAHVALVLAVPTILYVLSSLGPWMYLRFRVPVTPFLAIAAAVARERWILAVRARGRSGGAGSGRRAMMGG
jgi:hypothetical protein